MEDTSNWGWRVERVNRFVKERPIYGIFRKRPEEPNGETDCKTEAEALQLCRKLNEGVTESATQR